MIDFAINLEPLYPGMELCEKIERVAAAGFTAVEFWGWDGRDLAQIRTTCKAHGVKVRAFSGTGSWSLCDREHSAEYIDWIERSADAAKQLDCNTLILFPNHFTPDGAADFREQYSKAEMAANAAVTLARIAPILEKNGITALLEPLNNMGADAGMSVTDTQTGAGIVRAVGSDHVRLLCDLYHMQMMHGNLLQNLESNADIVPYIHIADAPDRHEPGTGEINFDFLCRRLLETGYDGTICFEYFPKGDTEAGFAALKSFCRMFGQ
ncbi:hypothetical protein D7X33_04130 [Butyricicoccus sp. 1XD8-22]|nr:hypothetical protein D7X33_04130 [Butyricicoccus sp. 1XD8-22]